MSELLVVTHVDPGDHETVGVKVGKKRFDVINEHLKSMVSILLSLTVSKMKGNAPSNSAIDVFVVMFWLCVSSALCNFFSCL